MNSTTALRQVAYMAFIISLVLLAVKFVAFFLTGSKAVLSDAVESIINVVTGAFLVVSIRISTQPVDENHPYGHGKIEAFSAGLEGGLIILAGIMILVEAVPAFFTPHPPQHLGLGTLILLGAGVANMLTGSYLLHTGKKLKSEALRADGKHLLTDFYTSGGVIIGLVLIRISGWNWLDPFIACLVAVNILIPGCRLLRNATRNLMNEAEPDFLERIVGGLNKIKKPGWLIPHKLRSIRSGRYHHIDLHISFPRYWTLDEVHRAEEELTKALLEAVGEEGDIMLHTDPCKEIYCQYCNVEDCPLRTSPKKEEREWTVQEVTADRSFSEDSWGRSRLDRHKGPKH
jgi:cation diffusion facilitator family transporter